MKTLAWITDPHLNFLDIDGVHALCAGLREQPADAFLITGDIGEAPDVAEYLNILHTHLDRPIYFVLGNHDFYRGSIIDVRDRIRALCLAVPNLVWLPAAGVVPLS